MQSLGYLPLIWLMLLVHSNSPNAEQQWEFSHSSNYRQTKNWIGARLPCPRDSVRLPTGGEFSPAIGLTKPVLVQRELLFPSEGSIALILFDGAGLKAFDDKSGSRADEEDYQRCSNRDRIREATFNLTGPLDWFRSENWIRRRSTAESQRVFDALPVDCLPGPCDSVRFTDDATYYVKMLGRGNTLSVGQLQIAGKTFTNQLLNANDSSKDLDQFWRESQLAKRQFVWSNGEDTAASPFSLRSSSTDRRDCEVPLPVQSERLMTRVCASPAVSSTVATCSNPIPLIEMHGACEDLCGSVVLTIQTEISLRRLREILTKASRVFDERSNLRLSAFRLSRHEPLYQLVLMRNDSDGGSTEAGKASVIEGLRWLESNAARMHFSIINTLISGDISERAPISGSLSSRLTASLTTVFLLLIVGATIVAFVFIGRKRGWLQGIDFHPRSLWQAWQQWRHQTLQEDTDVEFSAASGSVGFASSDASGGSRRELQTVAMSLAFTNPVYDVSQPDVNVDCTAAARLDDHEL